MINNTFSDIKNPNLKAWNRCALVWNLMADHGANATKDYLAQFSQADRDKIGKMFERIKAEGYSVVRAAVNREVQADAG